MCPISPSVLLLILSYCATLGHEHARYLTHSLVPLSFFGWILHKISCVIHADYLSSAPDVTIAMFIYNLKYIVYTSPTCPPCHLFPTFVFHTPTHHVFCPRIAIVTSTLSTFTMSRPCLPRTALVRILSKGSPPRIP